MVVGAEHVRQEIMEPEALGVSMVAGVVEVEAMGQVL